MEDSVTMQVVGEEPMRHEPRERTLQRYEAFWKRRPTDRPVIGVCLSPYMPLALPASLGIPKEGTLEPQAIDLGGFIDWYEEEYRASQSLRGDQFWVASPFWGVPWLEAILGCPIRVSGEAIWADSIIKDCSRTLRPNLLASNAWLRKLLEFTHELVARSKGRYPVATPLMRGPSDLVAALRGTQTFMTDLFDDPHTVKALASVCADTWIRVAKLLLELIPRFHGGGCSANRQIWAPDGCIETQEDTAGMVSPKTYQEFFLPCDRRILSSFSHGFMHFHSSYLQNMPAALQLPELAAVEITLDVSGPSLLQLLPLIQEAQEAKPVVIHGTMAIEEVRTAIQLLSPQGLTLMCRVGSIEEGNKMLDSLGVM